MLDVSGLGLHIDRDMSHIIEGYQSHGAIGIDAHPGQAAIIDSHAQPGQGIHSENFGNEITDNIAVTDYYVMAIPFGWWSEEFCKCLIKSWLTLG